MTVNAQSWIVNSYKKQNSSAARGTRPFGGGDTESKPSLESAQIKQTPVDEAPMKNLTLPTCPPPFHFVGPLVLAATLAACGGGGGDDSSAEASGPVAATPAQPPVQAPVQAPVQPPVQAPVQAPVMPPVQPPVRLPPPAVAGTPAVMMKEAGTNRSITLSADGLTVTSFGSEINPDCDARRGAYTNPIFNDPTYGNVACHKRAVRANAGVRPGEFLYFEGVRLVAPQNFAFGITRRNDDINPLCCYAGGYGEATPAHPLATPSMSVNTVGGAFVSLVGRYGFSSEEAVATIYYGLAIDYTGPNPVIFLVSRTATGSMLVGRFATTGFNGVEAVPMTYGHTGLNAAQAGVASVNFGQMPFHYNQPELRAKLRAVLIGYGASEAEATTKLNQFKTGVVTR